MNVVFIAADGAKWKFLKDHEVLLIYPNRDMNVYNVVPTSSSRWRHPES